MTHGYCPRRRCVHGAPGSTCSLASQSEWGESNVRKPVPETGALPLGDTPVLGRGAAPRSQAFQTCAITGLALRAFRAPRRYRPGPAVLKGQPPRLENVVRGDPCRCCPGFYALRTRRLSWWSKGPSWMTVTLRPASFTGARRPLGTIQHFAARVGLEPTYHWLTASPTTFVVPSNSAVSYPARRIPTEPASLPARHASFELSGIRRRVPRLGLVESDHRRGVQSAAVDHRSPSGWVRRDLHAHLIG